MYISSICIHIYVIHIFNAHLKLTIAKIYFYSLSNYKEYDRSDSFPFTAITFLSICKKFERNPVLFESKRNLCLFENNRNTCLHICVNFAQL